MRKNRHTEVENEHYRVSPMATVTRLLLLPLGLIIFFTSAAPLLQFIGITIGSIGFLTLIQVLRPDNAG